MIFYTTDANDQRKDYSAQDKTNYVLWNRFYCPVTSCSVFNWQRLKSLVLDRHGWSLFKNVGASSEQMHLPHMGAPNSDLRPNGSVLDVSVQEQRAFHQRKSKDVWEFRLEAETKNDKNVHQKIV